MKNKIFRIYKIIDNITLLLKDNDGVADCSLGDLIVCIHDEDSIKCYGKTWRNGLENEYELIDVSIEFIESNSYIFDKIS